MSLHVSRDAGGNQHHIRLTERLSWRVYRLPDQAADSSAMFSTCRQFDRRLERGPDTSIRKHQLRFSYIYVLPVGRGQRFFTQMNRVANTILGGWQFNGITTMLSGRLLSPNFSGADPANTNQFGGRPDRIGDGNIGDMRERIKAGLPMWDQSAFVVPQDGRGSYGNSGRFVLVGPGMTKREEVSILLSALPLCSPRLCGEISKYFSIK